MLKLTKFAIAVFICLHCFPACGLCKSPSGDSVNLQLRVLCYNIHHARGSDGVVDVGRIAQVIRDANPDLVALQEVDHMVRRSGRVAQVDELARQTGLNGVFVKQIDYDGGEYGQAILSKWPIDQVQKIVLPGTPDRESRIAGVATVRPGGHNICFATTHLHHSRDDLRIEQAKELNRIFANNPAPCILSGDLNAVPQSDTLGVLSEHWLTTIREPGSAKPLLSFPATEPNRLLDYILLSPEEVWRVIECHVIEESVASDHRPVFMLMELMK